MRRKKNTKPPEPPTHKEWTFYGTVNALRSDTPPHVSNHDYNIGYCGVEIYRYRMAAERIEEPVEVLRDRVRALWRGSRNSHYTRPLLDAAEELGFELDWDERGIDAKKGGA